MRSFAFLIAIAVLAVAIPVLTATPAGAAPVTINQCFVTKPKPLSKNAGGTQIVWTNTGTKTLSNVTFQVGYRNAENNYLRRVTDSGEFAPGTKLDHHFSLFNDVVFAGTTTRSCTVVSAK
jgi:hypothetical protein